MFDNYPPATNANNNPPAPQPVDMYAGIAANPSAQVQAGPQVMNQNQYSSMPALDNPPTDGSGSFKFLIIGLVSLVLVLAGSFLAYQMILKPKFAAVPDNATPIGSENQTSLADESEAAMQAAQNSIVSSSADTQITYTNSTSTATSTDAGMDGQVVIGGSSSTTVDLAAPTQPEAQDSDKDGLNDDLETLKGTNKNLADTDADLLLDGEEVYTYSTDPLKADTDGDSLSDGEEVKKYQTKPLQADTDADGFSDGEEVKNNYNPLGSGRLILSNK